MILKKKTADDKKNANLPSRQRVSFKKKYTQNLYKRPLTDKRTVASHVSSSTSTCILN